MEPSDAQVTFECIKTSLSQTKDGIILRLAIKPDECPSQLITDYVGARYMAVLVRMGDDEQPMASPETVKMNRAVQSAGMLCRNTAFQRYLETLGFSMPVDGCEKAAGAAMRELLGVESRAELRTDSRALQEFFELRDGFEAWRLSLNASDRKA